jgi:inhibitor of cysteine peptidase
MPKLLFVAGIVAAAVLVAGCTIGGDRTPSTNATAMTPLLLNESLNGSTITAPLNTTLTLELAENPSTGYSWNLTTTSGLRIASDGYVPAATNATIVGAGGLHRWEIITVAAGLQEVTGAYVRPWETGVPPAETFRAEVSVTA